MMTKEMCTKRYGTILLTKLDNNRWVFQYEAALNKPPKDTPGNSWEPCDIHAEDWVPPYVTEIEETYETEEGALQAAYVMLSNLNHMGLIHTYC